jgi:alpha-mannosidase
VPQVDAWDAELGLRAVPAGDDPILAPGDSTVALDGAGVMLTALKPAERGDGIVARVLNPTDAPARATLRLKLPVGRAVPVRLDEEPTGPRQPSAETVEANVVRLSVPPHALRSVRVDPG